MKDIKDLPHHTVIRFETVDQVKKLQILNEESLYYTSQNKGAYKNIHDVLKYSKVCYDPVDNSWQEEDYFLSKGYTILLFSDFTIVSSPQEPENGYRHEFDRRRYKRNGTAE